MQSLPTETVNTGEKIREDESKPDKGTQTEIERLEEDVLSRPSQGDDSDSGVRIVKPKKIGRSFAHEKICSPLLLHL